MIIKNLKERTMFQKFAPLIILAMFATGMYFMMQGMDNAVKMAKPEKETKK